MAQHSKLPFALILLALGATTVGAQGTNRPGDYVGVLFPNPAGRDWSATVGRVSYTSQDFMGKGLITNAEGLAKFLGSDDEMARLLRRGVVYNADGTENNLDNAIVDFSKRDPQGRPNMRRDMLVGIHLGSQGSRDYAVEIEKIEVKREGAGRPVAGNSGGGDGGASRLAVLRDQLRRAEEKVADLQPLVDAGTASTNQLLEAQNEVERLQGEVSSASAGVNSANSAAAKRVPNAFLEISYRITSRRKSATVVDPSAQGLKQQLHAPAHLVRIPHVPIDPRKTRWVDLSRPPVFPASMGAVSLVVKDSGSEESIGLRVNFENRVNFLGDEKSYGALLTEMVKLGEAIRATDPNRVVGSPIPVRESADNTGLSDNGTFELAVWQRGRDNPRTLKGSWSAMRETLYPLYEALHAIHLRIKDGISADEQERLAGRFGLDTLFMGVQTTQMLPGITVRIDKVGKVLVDGKHKGRLTEREWDLLGQVLDYVQPMDLPEHFAPRAESPTGLPDVATPRRFTLEAVREGTKHRVGGEFYGGQFQENDKLQVLKAVLDLIASRVARRGAEVAGVVGVEGEVVTLTRPLGDGTLSVTVNPIEGDVNAEALRQKLKEWAGKWVEVRSIARVTDDGAQMIVSNVLYPQLAELTGVFTGNALAYQSAGDRATGGSVNLAGPRMAALLAGQNGRWVKMRAYLFYNQNLIAETAYVEALQAVLSRRVKQKFLRPRKSAAEKSLIHLFSTPDGSGAPAGTLSVGAEGSRAVWITNRVGEFVYLPDYRAWARVNPELLHLSENPDVVDHNGPKRGGLDILRDVLRGIGGNSGQ
ncbi:MAG: hypothetical protein KDD82_12480 [Planctomycetes bacterium]|nr:hypothetical protein [Planctomycetota bacterium]